jgi:polyisoprenoid-binding protein YceI
MKKLLVLTVIAICTFLTSYGQSKALGQEELDINTKTSVIKWSCDYAFYFGGHDGDIFFKEGYFIKSNGLITGGTFIIDLNSITNNDIEEEEPRNGLIEHLKNEDFFNVTRYPTAKLVITKTRYHDQSSLQIFANLTIKGVTKPIDFQAKINYDTKTLNTKFKIDRTLWGINFKSKSSMDKLKESAIADGIGFNVSLQL